MRSAVSAVEMVDRYFDSLVKSRFIEMFERANKEQWEHYCIVDVCSDPDDIKCGPFGTQLSKNEYVSEGIAVWGIPEINSGLTVLPSQFVTPEKAKRLSAYEVIPGDIVMSRKGNVGICSVFPDSYESGIIHSDVIRIRVNPTVIEPVFLMHELHYSHYVRQQILDVSSGAIMPGTNVTKLKKMSIFVPPINLQKAFVRFVQQIDKSKFKMHKLIQDCDLAISSYLFELFGDPLINQKNWDVVNLSELTSVLRNGHPLNDKDYTEEGVDFLLSQNVWNNHFELDGIKYISKEKHESISDTQLKDKDILITKTGRISTENSSLGRIAMYRGEDDVVNISGEIFLVRVNEKICPEFLLYVLLTDSYRRYIRSRCPGSTDKRHLYLSIVEKFPIILPPMDLQKTFVEFVKKIEKIKINAIDKLNIEGMRY